MFEIVRAFRDAFGIESAWSFVTIVALFFGVIGGGVAFLVDRAYKNAVEGDLPLVIEWSIDAFNGHKTVKTLNRGGVEISDLSVHAIKWVLDASAWRDQRINIDSFSRWSGGPSPLMNRLRAGAEHTLDFSVGKSEYGVDLLPFPSNIPDGPSPILPKELLTFYSLRFHFRDARTGQQYHHDEVISAQADLLFPINPKSGMGGGSSPEGLLWVTQLSPTITAAAEKTYGVVISKPYPGQ